MMVGTEPESNAFEPTINVGGVRLCVRGQPGSISTTPMEAPP